MAKKISEMSREERLKEIRINALKINKSMAAIAREEIDLDMPSSFAKTQRKKFEAITGIPSSLAITSVPLGNIDSYEDFKLAKLLMNQRQYIESQFSTVKGRQEYRKRMYKHYKQNTEGLTNEQAEAVLNYRSKDYKNYVDLMRFFSKNPRIYTELNTSGEQGRIQSEQIAELIMSYRYKSSQLVEAFEELEKLNKTTQEISSNVHHGEWRVFLMEIMDTIKTARENNTGWDINEIYNNSRHVRH